MGDYLSLEILTFVAADLSRNTLRFGIALRGYELPHQLFCWRFVTITLREGSDCDVITISSEPISRSCQSSTQRPDLMTI